MYNPLTVDLMLQEMHERADEMRRARNAAPTRRWWRSGPSAGERRTR